MKPLMALVVLLFGVLTKPSRRIGNPLDHLPPNIEILTHFGERADISPGNQRIAFMAKSFGDAMVIGPVSVCPRSPVYHDPDRYAPADEPFSGVMRSVFQKNGIQG